MHIVQLAKYYPPHLGGIENNTRQCAQALVRDHRVTVLAFSESGKTVREKDGDVDVIRLRSFGKISSQELCFTIGFELKRLKPDIVHLHAPNPLAMLAYRMFTPHARLVITHHTDMVRQRLLRLLFLPLYRRLVRSCSALVVYTRKYYEDCTELSNLGRDPEIIPNGTMVPDYLKDASFQAEAQALREKTAPGDRILLCFIGRFVEYKGLRHLLHAMVACPNAHAVFAGDGPEREAIYNRVKELKLTERVMLVGPVFGRSKWLLLRASDFVVLPSINGTESFGQFLVEAQLCARPAIVTSIPGGVTEVVLPNQCGLVVPPGDVSALATAIRRLARDASLRVKLGAAGEARARSRYTAEAVDDLVRGLFSKVAKEVTAQASAPKKGFVLGST